MVCRVGFEIKHVTSEGGRERSGVFRVAGRAISGAERREGCR